MKSMVIGGVLLCLGLPLAAQTAGEPGHEPLSQDIEAQDQGQLNPEELSLERVMRDVAQGETSMTNCAAGYYITKSGRHALARQLFERCADAGWTGAMTWMGQLEDNGLGGPEDPQAAAEWDQRAAAAGDPVGMFNYGLDLMRGRGQAPDQSEGRRWVDEAAALGLPTAKRLQAADYDLDEVTPDADAGKYQQLY